MDVEVNEPCLMILQKEGNGVILSVADPTQKLDQIQIRVSGIFESDGAIVDGEWTVLRVNLPQNEWAGKSVEISLTEQ